MGLQQASGDYIAFLDSDDLWYPEKIQLQLETLRKTGNDVCFVAYDMIDETGRVIKHRQVKPDTGYTDLLKENDIIFSGVLGRAECIKEQRFDCRCFHEDYLFLLTMLQKGKRFCGINETLLQYRVHGSGKSFDKKNAAWQRWKIYRDYLHMGLIKSMYYFVIYAFNGVLKYI
jgi:teichuronic acid biosynthesis glycosyltransferase TuaG